MDVKKLLALFLFIPALALGQHKIDSWDTVRDGYYKIVVGQDTLPDNFTRYDTAVKFAYEYAEDSAQGQQIRILSPVYRFEYEYQQLSDAQLQSLLLKDLNWQHSVYDTTGFYELTLKAESIADSVRFQYYASDSTGTLLQRVNWRSPQGGMVYDTLRTEFDVPIQVSVEAYKGTDFYEQQITVHAEIIAAINEAVKKKIL